MQVFVAGTLDRLLDKEFRKQTKMKHKSSYMSYRQMERDSGSTTGWENASKGVLNFSKDIVEDIVKGAEETALKRRKKIEKKATVTLSF